MKGSVTVFVSPIIQIEFRCIFLSKDLKKKTSIFVNLISKFSCYQLSERKQCVVAVAGGGATIKYIQGRQTSSATAVYFPRLD